MLTSLFKSEQYCFGLDDIMASMARTKSKKESDKALLASVTKEMARPRVAESARIEADKQRTAKVGKLA
jgi:hypothetical protein